MRASMSSASGCENVSNVRAMDAAAAASGTRGEARDLEAARRIAEEQPQGGDF